MRIKLVPRTDDIVMVELWFESRNHNQDWYFGAVVHEDVFLNSEIYKALQAAREATKYPYKSSSCEPVYGMMTAMFSVHNSVNG